MKSDLQNFYLLMAGAGFTPYRVEELISEISKKTPQKIAIEYEKHLKQWGGVGSVSDNYYRKKQAPSQDVKVDVQSKAISLIMGGSDLTVRESLELVNLILLETFPDRKFSAPNPKAGIASWVRSLSRTLTDSELLHVATKFRNKLAHMSSNQQDWVLKEEDASNKTD
jgi:hypothetical protein